MCPYNEDKGFTADIATAVYAQYGYQVELVALPWARVAADTLNGDLHGALSAGKEETPDLLFPDTEIALQSDCFYGSSTDKWVAGNADSFLNRKTIIFKGWGFDEKFKRQLGVENYNASFHEFSIDEFYTKRVASMINLKRADAFWMDVNVFAYSKRNNPSLIGDNIRNLGCINHQKLYLALSPKNPFLSAKLSKEFDQGMSTLRKSGELAEILKKYGLTDWAQ